MAKMSRRKFLQKAIKAGALVSSGGALRFFAGSLAGTRCFLEAGANELGERHVILDAGHGGNDPGARFHGKKSEKDFNHAFAETLENALKKKGITVWKIVTENEVIVRNANGFEERERMGYSGRNLALRKKAVNSLSSYFKSRGSDEKSVVLVSIHADSRKKPVDRELAKKAGGAMVYTNSSTGSEGLAKSIVSAWNSLGNQVSVHYDPIRGFAKRNGREVRFAMTHGTMVGQSVLIEAGNMSDEKTNELLRKPAYLEKLAEGIAKGISSFFSKQGISGIQGIRRIKPQRTQGVLASRPSGESARKQASENQASLRAEEIRRMKKQGETRFLRKATASEELARGKHGKSPGKGMWSRTGAVARPARPMNRIAKKKEEEMAPLERFNARQFEKWKKKDNPFAETLESMPLLERKPGLGSALRTAKKISRAKK